VALDGHSSFVGAPILSGFTSLLNPDRPIDAQELAPELLSEIEEMACSTEEGVPIAIELTHSGVRHELSVQRFVAHDERGKADGHLLFLRDLSEQKQVESALNKKTTTLELLLTCPRPRIPRGI